MVITTPLSKIDHGLRFYKYESEGLISTKKVFIVIAYALN